MLFLHITAEGYLFVDDLPMLELLLRWILRCSETGVNANGGKPERRILQDPARPPSGSPGFACVDPGLLPVFLFPALQFFVPRLPGLD